MLIQKLTSRQEVKLEVQFVWSLKRIDDELWCCHDTGITVFSFGLKTLRDMKLGNGCDVYNVSPAENSVVVIASLQGLSTCLKQGL